MLEKLNQQEQIVQPNNREIKSRERFQDLKESAWKISEIPIEKATSNWEKFERDLDFRGCKIKSWFTYDPSRIEIDHLVLDNIEKDEESAPFRQSKIKEVKDKYLAWTQIDDDTFARPYLSELNLNSNDGFYLGTEPSIEDESRTVDFIQKGTLKAQLRRLPMNYLCYIDEYFFDESPISKKIIDNPDNVIIMDIMRTEEIGQDTTRLELDDFRGKNIPFIKKFSKPSFKSEIVAMVKKIKDLGYKIILADPSDQRRYGIYLRMGMKEIQANNENGGYLYFDLDSVEE